MYAPNERKLKALYVYIVQLSSLVVEWDWLRGSLQDFKNQQKKRGVKQGQ